MSRTLMPMQVRKVITVDAPGLHERIKESQEQSGKSIEQICRESDISRQTWYNIVNGYLKTGIDWDVLEKIEQSLGVDFGVKF